MTLLITVFAAVISTVSWYKKKKIKDIVSVTAMFYNNWDLVIWLVILLLKDPRRVIPAVLHRSQDK